MKRFFGIYDKIEEENLKHKVVSFLKIPEQYISFVEIYIESNEFIHVIYIDDKRYENKRDLVTIHGFNGTSLNFFKMFDKLSEKYRIIAVDLPGMGFSSRQDFSHTEHEKVEDYFLSKLKTCFDKLNLEKISLIAHSFGAYISSLFCLRYAKMVENLVLLSPVGLSANFHDVSSSKTEMILQKLCFRIKKTPNFIFQSFSGFISNYIFDVFSRDKFKGLKNKDELQTNLDIMHLLIRNKISSEEGIFALFDRNLQPYKPIVFFYELLREIPILVLYGDNDWNPRSQAEDLQKLLPETVSIDTVSESGHLLNFDNYIELTEKIKFSENKKEDVFDFTNQIFSTSTSGSICNKCV